MKGQPNTRLRRASSALTLVELIVSMAILTALVLLLFSMVDGTTKIWQRSEQRVDAFREARAALFIISRDLQAMVPAPDLGPEPYTTPSSNPGPTPTPAPSPNGVLDFKYFFINPRIKGEDGILFGDVAADKYGDRLFLLTALSSIAQGNAEKSDVCAVGYYLDFSATANAPNTFKLYRYFKGSNQTFTSLSDFVKAEPPNSSLMTPGSASDEVLARNVVDFRVTAYDKDLNKLNISPSDADYGKVTPYAVDLSITAYNYSAANNFKDADDWIDYSSIKNASSRQTFTTRVYLPRSGPTSKHAP